MNVDDLLSNFGFYLMCGYFTSFILFSTIFAICDSKKLRNRFFDELYRVTSR